MGHRGFKNASGRHLHKDKGGKANLSLHTCKFQPCFCIQSCGPVSDMIKNSLWQIDGLFEEYIC